MLVIFILLSSAALYYYMPARSHHHPTGQGGIFRQGKAPIDYARPSGTAGAWGGAAEVGDGGVGIGSASVSVSGTSGGGSRLGGGGTGAGGAASSSSSAKPSGGDKSGGGGKGGGSGGGGGGGGNPNVGGGGGGGSSSSTTPTPRARRNSGQGTGASKNLPFLNEAAVQRSIAAATKESPSGALRTFFKGAFVMHAKRRHVDEEIPFPRKKLRNTLTHYSLGRVTKQLVRALPPRDILRDREKQVVCAVVGNGGSLGVYELGAEIDEANVVIRLNAGPTRGFERHVGSRTDLRLVNRLHMGFRETATETVLQHVTTPDTLKKFVDFRLKNLSAPNLVLDPDFHEHAINHTDKGVLSNGFYGLLLANELCHNVRVYGFLRQWKGQVHYHYYNEEEPDGGQTFRDDREGDRLEQYLRDHRDTIRQREPCMDMVGRTCTVGAGAGAGAGGDREDEECGGSGASCPAGGTCACGVWHPVPTPGFCYMQRHARGRGLPDVTCMHRCKDPDACPGGIRGVCPPDPRRYHPECGDNGGGGGDQA